MNVQRFLNDRRVPFDILTHEPTYDAQHMAQAVHVSGREVAKTVLLRANHGYKYIVAVLPATSMIDFAMASRNLGDTELALATEIEMADICPDCEIGALPPFGSHYGLKTLVDESLAADEWIVFEGNSHTEAIRMKFADFCDLEHPLVMPIAATTACHAH
jgi:Ala-tRNA(Pro) deacylase